MSVEQVVSADGTPIAVWRSGEGPPLVLVHGAAADHSRWAPVLPALEERFTVLAIDRRGRGRSGDADDYALEREFEDVAAVVEWAGEAVNVLGHSHGGVCALEAALLTDRIGKLVLYEPPMGFLRVASRGRRAARGVARGGGARRAAGLLHARGGRPSPRADRVAALAAGLGGAARRGPHDPARGAREQGVRLRPGSLPRASRADAVPRGRRQPRLLQGGRRGACARRCRTAASSSCRGSDTPRWTPAPSCSPPRC